MIVKRPVAQETAEPQESAINQALLGNAPIAWELFTVSVTTAEHNSAAIIKIDESGRVPDSDRVTMNLQCPGIGVQCTVSLSCTYTGI